MGIDPWVWYSDGTDGPTVWEQRKLYLFVQVDTTTKLLDFGLDIINHPMLNDTIFIKTGLQLLQHK